MASAPHSSLSVARQRGAGGRAHPAAGCGWGACAPPPAALLVGAWAGGRGAAAPLVRKEYLAAVVVERGRMPEREVRVGHRADPLRGGHVLGGQRGGRG